MEIERLDQATADLVGRLNGRPLTGNEVHFGQIFANKPTFLKSEIQGIQLQTVTQAGRLEAGDRATLVSTPDSWATVSNSEAGFKVVTLRAGCPNSTWLPEVAHLLKSERLIHIVYGAKSQTGVKVGLEILHTTTKKGDQRKYFSALEARREIDIHQFYSTTGPNGAPLAFSCLINTEIFVMTIIPAQAGTEGVLQSRGNIPGIQIKASQPDFKHLNDD